LLLAMREQTYVIWAVRPVRPVRRARERSIWPAFVACFESERRLTGVGCHFGNPSDPSGGEGPHPRPFPRGQLQATGEGGNIVQTGD
jgi:hypothetical protein